MEWFLTSFPYMSKSRQGEKRRNEARKKEDSNDKKDLKKREVGEKEKIMIYQKYSF